MSSPTKDVTPSEYPYNLGLEQYDTHLQMFGFSANPELSEEQKKDVLFWLRCGLVWMYNFHHEEAMQCFLRVLQIDRCSAMAHWGISYSNGPNYNAPSMNREVFPSAAAAYYHAIEAGRLAALSNVDSYLSDAEKDLIDALQIRFNPLAHYPKSPMISQNTKEYADAMRIVYNKYSTVPCMCCAYAEALMNFHPWKLWDLDTGVPAEHTDEIKSVIEDGLKLAPQHPGLNHLYIHLMEMSQTPALALPSCAVLRTICPHAGKYYCNVKTINEDLNLLCSMLRAFVAHAQSHICAVGDVGRCNPEQ